MFKGAIFTKPATQYSMFNGKKTEVQKGYCSLEDLSKFLDSKKVVGHTVVSTTIKTWTEKTDKGPVDRRVVELDSFVGKDSKEASKDK